VASEAELGQAGVLFADMAAQPVRSGGDDIGFLARGRALGLDVEWRPTLEKRSGMQKHRRCANVAKLEPCATLQVAADDFVVIFDLLALAPASSPSAEALSSLIASLFDHAGIVKLGFGLRNDLQRLAASYPHMGCFRRMRGVIDVQDAWFQEDRHGSGCSAGLSALCARHLGAPVSKRLQTSDWGERPLRPEQVSYAALDAHCLLGLARALPGGGGRLEASVHSLGVQASGASGQLIVVEGGGESGGGGGLAVDAREVSAVDAQIVAKGKEIREMKAAKSQKAAVQAEVAVLLQLKARFREVTGVDWVPAPSAS